MTNEDVPVVRLTTRAQFIAARHGITDRKKSLVIQATKRYGSLTYHVGEGFTATKKIGGAVQRNKAKRRLRHASRALLPKYGIAGCDYVFIARGATLDVDWQRLLDDMESSLISLAAKL